MTRADAAVLLSALLLLFYLYGLYWGERTAGEAVRIRSGDGAETVVSLAADRQLEIDGPLGTSIIEIRDGRVRFAASPCRNQLCVHSGWLGEGGEVAACLPNRISVAVIGRELRYDSINF